MTWAPSGKSTTSSVMTLTGEMLLQPLHSGLLPLTWSRKLLSAPGEHCGPVTRAPGWDLEPEGTAAGVALVGYNLAQVP